DKVLCSLRGGVRCAVDRTAVQGGRTALIQVLFESTRERAHPCGDCISVGSNESSGFMRCIEAANQLRRRVRCCTLPRPTNQRGSLFASGKRCCVSRFRRVVAGPTTPSPSGMITLRTSSVLKVESLDDFTARSIETNWFALIEA